MAKSIMNQTYASTILTDYCIAQNTNALVQLAGILQFLLVNTFEDLKSSCRIKGECPSSLYLKHCGVDGKTPTKNFTENIWILMGEGCQNQQNQNKWAEIKYEDDVEKMLRVISVSYQMFIFF